MIEVEKKFRLNPEQEAKLVKGAKLDYKKVNVDIFYDNDTFDLSRNDTWLRQRNGRWELKVRKHEPGDHSGTTAYEELETDKEVAERLGLPSVDLIEKEVELAGYNAFAKIEKHRRSYLRDDFRIDLDQCDFGYALAEIELLVDSPDKQQEAVERIDSLAQSLNLDQSPVRAKVVEYLYRFSPDHYQVLVDAGVI